MRPQTLKIKQIKNPKIAILGILAFVDNSVCRYPFYLLT